MLTWPKNPKIDDAVGAINALDVRMSATETRVGVVDTAVAAVDKRLVSVESRLAAIEKRVTAAEAGLVTSDKRVASIEATANGNKVRLDDLDHFKADHSAGAVERQREVDRLRSGADRLRWAISHGRRP